MKKTNEKVETKEKVKKEKKKKLSRISIRNFRTKSAFLLFLISGFRIAMIVVWLIAPVIFAFTIAFDTSIRNLIEFIWSFAYPEKFTQVTRITIAVVAPFMWLLSALIMLGALVKPFFKKRYWVERAYLAFNQIFWPIIFIGIIYGIYFTIPYYETGTPSTATSPSVDPVWQAWKSLSDTFSFSSGWMIALQCVYIVLIIFGLFSIFEAHMVRKMKVDYKMFSTKKSDERNLVNQVIEGKIQFGEFDPDEVDKELKKIRKEAIEQERKDRFEKMQKLAEDRKIKKDAKKRSKIKTKKGNEVKEDAHL